MSKNILQVNDITMQFGGVVAVDNLSLEVNEGEIVALIGPNGAGKTTAFNCITGVYEPSNGSVSFCGKELVESYPRGKMKKLYKGENVGKYTKRIVPTPDKITYAGIARTFQNIRLFSSMTVFENVLIAKHMRAKQNLLSATFRLNHAEEERMRKYMHKQRILVKQIWFLDRQDEKKRISLTMRTRGGQCLTMKEVAKHLSHVCGCRMVPSQDSKAVLNSEWRTVLFCEDVNYKVLYGVARVTKERETISGDNYACAATDEQFTMCLSDGMGSGMEASKESETVVELLEQFVTSGFSRETAVRMVNSALILQRKGGMFSSLDVCSLDLYTGICEFLKAGAATTFIRRGNWVETITSTSMAAGLVQKLEFEKTTKKLYDGDYLVMVTDGVLDAFGEEPGEEILKEWILQAQEQMPKELGRHLLEKTLQYADYRAKDDMTVLVAGIWRK